MSGVIPGKRLSGEVAFLNAIAIDNHQLTNVIMDANATTG
jgi:hypothetical protein